MKIHRNQTRDTRLDMQFMYYRKRDVLVLFPKTFDLTPYRDEYGVGYTRTFSYLTCGGKNPARSEARQWRDNMLKRFPQLAETKWKQKLLDPTKGVFVQTSRPLVTATYHEFDPRTGETKRRQKSYTYDETDPRDKPLKIEACQAYRLTQNKRYIAERERYEKETKTKTKKGAC